MSIKLKPSTSSSDQYYQLNDRVISEGNREGAKAGHNAKDVSGKLTKFSKNILKSTKNLAFDIVDEYTPNAKEVKNSFKEAASAAKEDFDKEFGPMLTSAKNFIKGLGKEGETSLKSRLAKEGKEIKDRLKSGKFYTSMEDEIEESFGGDFDFGSSDFDFDGGSSSYTTVAEPDSLSAEPFGGVKKGKTRTVNVTHKQKQLRAKTTNVKPRKSSSGASSQLRLGDELVSNTTGQVGQSIVTKQEEIWARTHTANEKNFAKLFGYQNQILKSVNSIVDFNNKIISENVRAQMEFQGKLLAAQQDSLSQMKELKDAMIVLGTYKPEEQRKQTLNSRINNSPIGLNGKAYWENIKKNLAEVAASNPMLSMLTMTPMVSDMLSMSGDTGIKFVNPLNMGVKGIASAFLSPSTKNRMRNFNNLLSNFGGLFTGKMNELARYGNNNFVKTLGRIFGNRTTTVRQIDMGLKDPFAVVGWTAKSDRTLNEVIPALLSKQLAAISGGEELTYDYKSGMFKKSSSVARDFQARKDAAYESAEVNTFNAGISKYIATSKSLTKEEAAQSAKNVKTITLNIIKNGLNFRPELINQSDYKEQLTKGISDNEKDSALLDFIDAYNNMSDGERIRFIGATRKVANEAQEKINAINDEAKKWGGGNAVAESGLASEIAERERALESDLRLQYKNKPAGKTDKEYEDMLDDGTVISTGDVNVRAARLRARVELQQLRDSNIFAKGKVVKAKGFGAIGNVGTGSQGGINSTVSNIFKLLAMGIPVYNQGKRLPSNLKDLRSQLGVLEAANADVEEAAHQAEEDYITLTRSEMANLGIMQFKNNRLRDAAGANLFSMFNPFSSGTGAAKINNAVNSGLDMAESLYGMAFLGNRGSGQGIMDRDISYNAMYTSQLIANGEKAQEFLESWQNKIAENQTKIDDPNTTSRKRKWLIAQNKYIASNITKLLSSYIETNKKKISNASAKGESKITDSEFWKKFSNTISEFSNKYIVAEDDSAAYQKYLQDHEILNRNVESSSTPIAKNTFTSEYFNEIKTAGFEKGKQKINNVKSNFESVKLDAETAKLVVSTYVTSRKNNIPPEEAKKIVVETINNKEIASDVIRVCNQVESKAGEIISSVKGGASTVKAKVSEILSDTEEKMFNRWLDLSGRVKEGFEKADAAMQNEINKYPKLKKKINQTKKNLSKKSKKAVNEAEKIGKESKDIFMEGMSDAGSKVGGIISGFNSRSLKGIFGGIGGLGKSIFSTGKNLISNTTGHFTDERHYGNYVDLSGGVKGRRRVGTGIGAGLGSLAGILIGHPLLGGMIGGGIGRAIGGIGQKKYVKLRGALLEMGHIDAATMKPKDLYALTCAIKGRRGNSLRQSDEFAALEKEVYKPTIFKKIGNALNTVKKNVQQGYDTVRMTLHGTLPYKNLVRTLDKVLNNDNNETSEKYIDVYSMDKFMLYATVSSLSTKTKEERKVKQALMNSPEYVKLKNKIETGESGLHAFVTDKINKVRRLVNRGRHFKYRFLLDFLKHNGVVSEDGESVEYVKDPAMLYSLLDSWGSKRKNQSRYAVLKRSKAFLNLEKAVVKKGNLGVLSKDQLKSVKQDLRGGFRNRKKYAILIDMLKNNNIPIEGTSAKDIHLGMIALLTRLDKTRPELANGIRRSDTYKKLCKAVGAETEALDDKPERVSFFGRIRNGLAAGWNRLFGNKTNYDEATNTVNLRDAHKKGKLLKKYYKARRRGQLTDVDANTYAGIDVDEDNRPRLIDRAKGWVSSIGNKLKNFGGLVKSAIKTSPVKPTKAKDKATNEDMEAAGNKIMKMTKDPKAALLASIAAGTAGMNRLLNKTAFFLGMNDKGELDEKRKESLAGQLHDDLGNINGDGKNKGGGIGNFLKFLLDPKKGGIGAGATIAGILSAAGLAVGGAAIVKNVVDSVKIGKEQGVEAAGGRLFGGTQNLDESKADLARAGNARVIGKTVAMGGAKKAVGNVKTLGAGIKAAKVASAKAAKKAATEGVKDVFETVAKKLGEFFANPKVIGKIGKKAASEVKQLPSKIVSRMKNAFSAAKQGLSQGLKSAKNTFSQGIKAAWPVMLADAVWCLASGMNDAGAYFNVLPKDVTGGVRIAAGLTNAVISLVESLLSMTGAGIVLALGMEILLPKDWLIQTIYNLVANDQAKEELKNKQEEAKDRAKALGVDAEKLTRAENRSLGSKMVTGVQAAFSKKTYKEITNEKIAKQLGMTPEEYAAKSGNYEMKQEGSFKEKYPLFSTLTSPSAAISAFNNPELYKQAEQEAMAMFQSGDMKSIYKVYKNIHNKKLGTQDRDTKNLEGSFRSKVANFLKDPKIKGFNLGVNEARRDPFTQFAYFSKGRADDAVADSILKLAGFKGGLGFWGGDNSTNTRTLNSNHLGGLAIDFNISKLKPDQLKVVGDTAKKYGIEWGGTWSPGGWDKPHFQDANKPDQAFATGGIVKASGTMKNYLENFGDKVKTRLNPRELVLNMGQQTALFNKIKKYERDESNNITAKGSNTLTSLTNETGTLKLINETLNIQNKVYLEQVRHNKVSEKFYKALLTLVMGLAGSKSGGIQEQIDGISEDLINGAEQNASGL